MPYTINGIGTTYYGKKNLQPHPGICEGCGRQGMLENYETGLYFTVLFIPLIPLGKQQILDYCPSCTRHRAVPAGEWKNMAERSIAERMERASRNPDDPTAAMEMHGCLDFFGRKEEAARLAGLMESRFAGNADVQLYLGGWHESLKHDRQADECFERALAAAPDNPAAARAVGIGCIQRGDLKRARELLGQFIEPGPNQDPAVVCLLASTLAERGEQAEALALYEKAKQGAPELAKQRQFRKAVRAAERGSAGTGSILPAASGAKIKKWIPVAVAAVLAAGVLGANRWLAGSQSLWVVNGLKVPADVSVDGGRAEKVGPRTWRKLNIAEGRHRATVRRAGLPDEQIDFEVSNGWFERFARDSAFVLNPAGAAVVVRETTVYAANPGAGRAPPASYSVDSFVALRDIDYSFEEFPRRLQVESNSTILFKSRAWALTDDPAGMLGLLANTAKFPPAKLLGYVERHLEYGGADAELLRLYVQVGAGLKMPGRCVDFLAKGLDRRPVNIEWHRMYQGACGAARREQDLEATYDRMLAADPGNSALLYLRGRLALKGAQAMDYFRRSMQADAQNAYPRLAAAYQCAARGDLATARQHAAEACRLRPGDSDMADQFFTIRAALGEFSALAAEARAALKKKPLDTEQHERLVAVLCASGDDAGADQAYRAYLTKLVEITGVLLPKGTVTGPPSSFVGHIPVGEVRDLVMGAGTKAWLDLLYGRGEFERMLKDGAALKSEWGRGANAFRANLELGRPAEAEKSLGEETGQGAAYPLLLLSSAWKRAGNETKAAQWRAKAIEVLAAGDRDDRAVAGMLGKGTALDVREALDELSLSMQAKAIVLVAMADVCPAGSAELLALARRINIPISFPHHFLKRATAGAAKTEK